MISLKNIIGWIGLTLFALATALPYLYYIAPDFLIKHISYGIIKSYIPRCVVSSLLSLWINLSDRAGKKFVEFLVEHGNHSQTCERIARLGCHLAATSSGFGTQLNEAVNVEKILQIMSNPRLGQTCLCALGDLIAGFQERKPKLKELVREPNATKERLERELSQTNDLVAILLSDGKEGIDRLISSPRPDSIPTLVALLRIGTPDMITSAAFALGMMAMNNDQMKVAVGEAGVIPSLVAVLQGDGTWVANRNAWGGDPDTGEQQTAAADALGLIAEGNEQMRIAVAQAGAIPILVNYLQDGNNLVKSIATRVLIKIAEDNTQNLKAVAFAGAIPMLVTILDNIVDGNDDMAWGTCDLLLLLSREPSIKEQIRPYRASLQVYTDILDALR